MARLFALTCAALLVGGGVMGGLASAARLDLRAASGPNVRAGVSGLDLLGGQVSFGISNRALDLGYAARLNFSVLGTLSARANAASAFAGGSRLALGGSGTLGPVALTADALAWSAPLGVFNPLVTLGEAGAEVIPAGASLDATLRYRVQRSVLLLASGHAGVQPNVAAGLEFLRGDLSLRAGVRAGDRLAAVTAGVSARRANLTFAADTLLGPQGGGVVASLALANLLGPGSSARAYVAYEPWRVAYEPLRYGLETALPLGPGTLNAAVRAGATRAGLRVDYSVPLGGF